MSGKKRILDNTPMTADEQVINAWVEEARTARSVFSSTYNNFYNLAAPWRPRVGEKSKPDQPRAPSEQDDIFDTTLQDAVDDWASDCADEFTPSYRPWTTFSPLGGMKQFSPSAQKKISEIVVDRMKTIFDAINQSSYEEQSQEAWVDLAIAPTGMDIEETPAGLPISMEHVPSAELLIIASPFGGPGNRCREREIPIRDLDVLWPQVDWSHHGDKQQRKLSTGTVTIRQVHTRDWYNRSEEVWTYRLMENGRTRGDPVVTRGPGSCRLIVARSRVTSPSAYGIGHANKAIAPARTLDQMAYLTLKREGRALDPPVIYSDPEAVLNLEGGLDNGIWYEAGDGFNVHELYPQSDAREVWFKEEDLKGMVRRALFQDKPYQRGDTPPTAAQWMSEEERNARRKGFPRARIVNEWVLPIIRRVEYILRKRKEIDDQEIEGKLVQLQPISPMSRASDLQEVQMADQHMQMFAARFGEMAIDFYNIPETMRRTREKMGTTVIVPATEDELEQKRQSRMMEQAAAKGLPAGGGMEQ
jgi:hypothetical protein